jgi:hypothetical protein
MRSAQRTLISAMTTGRPSSRRYSIRFASRWFPLPRLRRPGRRHPRDVGVVEPHDPAPAHPRLP